MIAMPVGGVDRGQILAARRNPIRQGARLLDRNRSVDQDSVALPRDKRSRNGCFSVNSMNQFAVLPPAAQEIVAKGRAFLKDLIARNVEAVKPTMKPTVLAEMILTFFTGISMEQHLNVRKAAMNRKVDDFMKVVRQL
jgi:hypothetical protein